MLGLFALNVSLFSDNSTLCHAFGNYKGTAPATSAPLFGGQPTAGGAAAAPAAPLFGAPSTTPAASGGSSAPSAPLFGTQGAAPSFGSTKPDDSKNAASVPVFGSPPPTTTATDSNKKPANPSFTGFAASTPANTPAPAPTNGKPPAASGFPGFSGASTGGNLFGNAPTPADGGKAPAAGFSFAGLGGGTPGDPSADKDKASGAAAAPLFPNLNTAPGGDAKAPADANKAPAGFGFGAANSTTPAPATTVADGSKNAPPVTTFNFNANTAPAAGVPAPATGGFSLSGAPTTPADNKTPATPTAQLQDPATPAPVSTPVPNAGNTPAGGTPAPGALPEPKPLHYQTLTVEQILNKFQKELEKDAMEYIDQAKRVCEYDAVLRDSQRDLAQITTQTQRLMLEQQQVEKALEGIGALQDELDSTLSEVEGHVDELFARQSHLAPQDADFERERAYATASTVDRRLEELKENMAATASQINSANERAFTGDVANIVAILNQHQDGLSSLQNAARKMEMDVTNISRMLNSSRF